MICFKHLDIFYRLFTTALFIKDGECGNKLTLPYGFSGKMGVCCHDNSNVPSMAEMLRWRVYFICRCSAHRGEAIQIMESISCDFWSREALRRNNKGIKWACAKHQPLVTDGYLTSDCCLARGNGGGKENIEMFLSLSSVSSAQTGLDSVKKI